MEQRLGLPTGSLLGAADIADLLGVTRQRVTQLQKEPTFPRSFTGYGRVRFWRRAGIECWAAAHRPDGARIGGRFVGDAAELLLAAEARARDQGMWWVDSMTVWLAVAHGDAGDALQHAVVSMGMTADEIESEIQRWKPSDERPRRWCRMNAHLQARLAAADRLAEQEGRNAVRAVDILLACIDEPWHERSGRQRRQPSDHVLAAFRFRGLDIRELRRRLVAAQDDPAVRFRRRMLRQWVDRLAPKPDWLALAPNPLGHDPWERRPWGAAFAWTRDGRHLEVDDEWWFFTIDGDGFYVRAADGRPVGYRYRKLTKAPKRNPKPVNGFMEILPMPPVEMHDWPERRFGADD
jgi:hypothetical protein